MTFQEYLTARDLSVDEDLTILETLADDFFEGVKFCTTPPPEVLEKATYKVAYAHSSNGGGFNDNEISEGKITVKEGLGRGALVDEYEIVDKSVLANDKISKLKRLGLYDYLSEYLCAGSSIPAAMVV